VTYLLAALLAAVLAVTLAGPPLAVAARRRRLVRTLTALHELEVVLAAQRHRLDPATIAYRCARDGVGPEEAARRLVELRALETAFAVGAAGFDVERRYGLTIPGSATGWSRITGSETQ
jgi:hypothetical protein